VRTQNLFLTTGLIVAMLGLLVQPASGQIGGAGQVAGVEIDANGVLKTTKFDPRLTKQLMQAGLAKLDREIARASDSRKVSLNRLEAAIADRLAKGQPVTDDIKNLAGLTRIENVFYFPDTKDIVLAGPAEGYAPDQSGRMIGVHSGRSIIELQDLIVALRAFPPGRAGVNVISVSIDPSKEGLAAMQQFLGGLKQVSPSDDVRIATGLRQSLGLQNVTIRGISPETHFAQVLVEADYRMKLIGIGLERPPVKIESYVSRANPKDVSRNAMERWFFTPNYECVRVSEDHLAMELVGDGVKLIGENERVTAEGGRVNNGAVNRASQAFVQQFTAKYGELAQKSPVYAQLRNLIDLSIATAYIQQQDFCTQAGWNMELFLDEAKYPVETHPVPKQVETAVNVVWKGSTLMTPIGGGVNIQAKQALSPGNVLKDEKGELTQARKAVKVDGLAAGQWWWD